MARQNRQDNKAPSHLREPTARWWESVLEDFLLDPHHVRLLTMAAGAWDRAQEAGEAIAEHGLTYVDRHGSPRARPECAVERDNKVLFARLIRELKLDLAEPPGTSLPRGSAYGPQLKGAM